MKTLKIVLEIADSGKMINPLSTIIKILVLCLVIAFIELCAFSQINKESLAGANKIYEEAVALFDRDTAESLQTAETKFTLAAEKFGQLGDKRKQALSLSRIGAIADKLGDKLKALKNHNLALSLFRAVGSKKEEGTTLSDIGLVYVSVGENQKALESFNQALTIARAVGNRGGEASALNNIGLVYRATGEKQKALDYFTQALPALGAVGDKKGEAVALSNIGSIYDEIGEKRKALENLDQSLVKARAANDKNGEAITLNNIGKVYVSINEPQKAIDYFKQSLPILRATGNRPAEAAALGNLGKAFADLGEKEKALDYYNQSLPIRRAVGDRSGEAAALNNIGAVYKDLGEKEKSFDYFAESLPLSRAAGDKSQEAVTLYNLMFITYELKNPRFAAVFGVQSFNVFQQLRANLKTSNKSVQQSYLKSLENVYRTIAQLLTLVKRSAQAQQILDLLKDGQTSADKQTAPLALSPREATFLAAFDKKLETINNLSRQLSALRGDTDALPTENAESKRLKEGLQKAKDDYFAFLKAEAQEFARPV